MKNIKIIGIIYCVLSFAIMFKGITIDAIIPAIMSVLFFALVASPQYYIFNIASRNPKKIYQAVLLILQVILSIVGIYAFYDTTFIHLDAQGGLVFIFIPIYQNIIIFGVDIILKIINNFTKPK